MISRKRGSQIPMSLDAIRGYLPYDSDDALLVISKVSEIIEWERKADSCQVVDIDLSSGTSIVAIQFRNQNEMVFHFSEGTSVLVDQRSKSYRIAEHIYEHLSMKLGAVKSFNYSKHNEAVRMIRENFFFEDKIISNLAPKEMNYLFYHCFTKSRSGNDDVLYNPLDINSSVSRHEQFCAYVLYTVHNLSRIPDVPGMVVALVEPSDRFRHAIQDRLASVQSGRKNPLRLALVDTGQLYSKKCLHVYYVLDLFTGAGSIDIGYEYSLDKTTSVDSFLSRRLKNVSHYIGTGSSLIFLSYKMFQNMHHDPVLGKYYVRQPDTYSISQMAFIPHKPWMLTCVSLRGSPGLLDFFLKTTLNIEVWVMRRNTLCNLMIKHNLHRNYDMCNEEAKKRLYYTVEMIELFDTAYPRPGQFEKAMQFPVKLKKTRIAHSNLTTVDMTSLVIGIEHMKEDQYYHSNDMTAFFSTKEMLQRAIDLNLIVVSDRKGQQYYSKVKSKYDVENRYFDVPIEDPRFATLLFQDGSISTGQEHDYKVLRVPFVLKSSADSLYDTELDYRDTGGEYGIGDYRFELKSPVLEYADEKDKNISIASIEPFDPGDNVQDFLSPNFKIDVDHYKTVSEVVDEFPPLHEVQGLSKEKFSARLGIHLWNLLQVVNPSLNKEVLGFVVGHLVDMDPEELYSIVHDFGSLVSLTNQLYGYYNGLKLHT